jgi:putative Holliday junction resolvase
MTEEKADQIPKGYHFLAIDYGTKCIGLASYKYQDDPMILLQERLIYTKDQDIIDSISQFIDEEFVNCLVLGVPYLDGKVTPATEKILNFNKKLSAFVGIPIKLQDESLSTYEAKDRMKQDPRFNFQVDMKKIDSYSAMIILESYLRDHNIHV